MINTTDALYTGLEGSGNYDIYVYALDNAGNLSDVVFLDDLDVDQSYDYPVITVNILASAPVVNLFGTGGTISGSISDDDSVDASSIKISFDDGVSWEDVTNQGSDGTSVNWSHDLDSSVFNLIDSSTPYSVKIQASDGGDGANSIPARVSAFPSAPYVVAVDRSLPALTVDSIDFTDRYDASSHSVTGASMSGALINNNFTITLSASDASDIAEIAVSVDGGAYATAGVTDNGDGTWTLTVPVDVATGGDDGTKSFSFRARDSWNKDSFESLAVVIDTTEPTVSYLEPADGARVNGDVTVRGTTFDVSALDSMTMTAGLGDSVALVNGGTLSSWSAVFDAYDYDEAAYATETVDGDGISTWEFPLKVTSYDAAGNRTIASQTVFLDPEGDKPVIVPATVQPGVSEAPYSDSVSVAGTIVMQSSVTDDDSPSYVLVYADLNDDGDYADDYAYDLNGDTDTDDAFETEGTPLQVSVTNGVWTALLNENSEFGLTTMTSRGVPSPTGYLRFFMIPYDINGTAGNPVVCRIYIDANAPGISGLNYNSGDLVRGSMTLTGTIQDDAALDTANDIKISFDGGTTYGALSVTQTGSNPFTYDFSRPIDTTAYDGADDSGILNIVIQVSDETYKQSNYSLSLNVDNSPPAVSWNDPARIPYIGIPPNEIYDFFGDNDTAGSQNQLFGSATDSGLVSGIGKINVYFVKNGNFESPKAAVAPSAVTLSVAGDELYDEAGTAVATGIPFTEDSDYIITIDNRIENGAYDQVSGVGDEDGFQESLKAKSGYDEWYAYFDTAELPDGPIDVYYVAYDDAGNKSYGTASAQISNHPPSIDHIYVSAGLEEYSGLIKRAGSLYLNISASDIEGIDAASYKATVTGQYEAPNGAATTGTPAIGTELDIAHTDVGDFANDITVDITGWDDIQYTLTIEVADTDGNLATQDMSVWVSNTDSTAPTVGIDDFDQDNLLVNVDIDEDGFYDEGHIESGDDSTDDGYADISGSVRITGTAWDDTSVDTIELSFDGGSTWTAVPADQVSTTSVDAVLGTHYSWYYDWDSSTISGVAQQDFVINVRVSDTYVPTANTGTGSKTVDIVPYITDITGLGMDTGFSSYLKRSATGRYTVSLSTTGTMRIEGYNLNPATVGVVAGSSALAVTDQDSAKYQWVDVSLDSDAMMDPSDASGATLKAATSGALVVTTNGVASMNNTNDNDTADGQNREGTTLYPDRNDDRVIAFWSLESHSSLTDKTEAVMKPDSGYSDMNWYYVTNNKELYFYDTAETMLSDSYGSLRGGDFAFNSDGSLLYLFFNNSTWWQADMNGIPTEDTFEVNGSVQWGADLAYNGNAWDWNWENSNMLGLGNQAYPNTGGTLVLNRYENIRLIASGNDSDTLNLGVFFDNSTTTRGIAIVPFHTGSGAGFTHNTTLGTVGADAWYSDLTKATEGKTNAGYDKTSNYDTGLESPVRYNITSGSNDSEYFDIAMVGTTAVLVYYDESGDGKKLMLTYNLDPSGTPSAWSVPVTVDTNAGTYVSMAVDSGNHIHLAYLDSENSVLKYAYLETYTSSARTTVVDTIFSSGLFTDITVRDFGGSDFRPVISSYSSAFYGSNYSVRIAYPVNSTWNSGADLEAGGSLDGYVTGDWELIAAPATSAPQQVNTFIANSTSAINGDIIVGYNGDYLEEARLLF